MFEIAKTLLPATCRPLSGLVIGAGLGYDKLIHKTGKSIFGFTPSDVFSWEPLEMLKFLRTHHPDSDLTVIDINDKVCRRLSEQSSVPVNNSYKGSRDYAERFLEHYPHQRLDELAIDEINRQLKERWTGKVSLVASASVPIAGSIINHDFVSNGLSLGQYDIVTLLMSGSFMEEVDKVYGRVNEILRPGGIFLFDDSFGALHPEGFIRRAGNSLRQAYAHEYGIEGRDPLLPEVGRCAVLVKGI